MGQQQKNMKINVNNNIKSFTKDLQKFKKVDVPNITRIAINETAKEVQKFSKLSMKKSFDRPRPTTINSVFIIFAKKTNLTAVITFRDWAQEFIHRNIQGGVRSVKNTAVPTINAKLNKYGNIPNRRGGVGNKQNQFRGVINGIYGVWEKNKKTGKLTIIHRFETNPVYSAIFPFYRIAKKTANTFIDKKFVKVADYYIRKAGYK